jgi:hypothetical protein
MTAFDRWPVEISLHEQDRETRAEARLIRDIAGMVGHGLARRNPEDQHVTQIGKEIAAARVPCPILLTSCSAMPRGRSRGSRTSVPSLTSSCLSQA